MARGADLSRTLAGFGPAGRIVRSSKDESASQFLLWGSMLYHSGSPVGFPAISQADVIRSPFVISDYYTHST